MFGIGKRNGSSAAVPLTMDNNRFLPTSNAMIGLSTDETLVAGRGTTLMSVPTGTWVSFNVTSPIAANSTWTLSVTVAGKVSTFTGQPQGHAQWAYLGPILFISNANTRTTTAIKSISAVKL